MEPAYRRELTKKAHIKIIWNWYRNRVHMEEEYKKWQLVPILKTLLWKIHSYYKEMRKRY
jgi:hypothetical protein